MNTYLLVFLSVLGAELGDKTQLATLVYATDPAANKVGVFAAAAGALTVSTLLAVVVGSVIGSWLPAERLKVLAGIAFVAIGLWMLLARS
jgi:putative Ca2+/H+ antiporter (TMEM165/GDT1 family)